MADPVDISGNFQPFNIKNSAVPPEGPRAVRIPLNFSGNASLFADLSGLTQGQPSVQMSYVQTLFIDNSANPNSMTVLMDVLQHKIVIPANSQAFLPVLSPNPPKLLFTSVIGAFACNAWALNFPVSPAVWATNNPLGSMTFSGGSLKVTDVIMDALVANYNTYGPALAVADLGLQSLISGGALKVTGGGGGLAASNLRYDNYIGIGNTNAIAGTVGKQIVITNLFAYCEPLAFSAAAAGDTLLIELRDGGAAGFVAALATINLPGGGASPAAVAPLGFANVRTTNIDYAITVSNNLWITTSTIKGSAITFTGPNPGLRVLIDYLLQ